MMCYYLNVQFQDQRVKLLPTGKWLWKRCNTACLDVSRWLLKTKVSVKHIYFYFIIQLATCFDPTGSSSGLHYEPTCLKSCVHSWVPKQRSYLIFVNIVWDPKNVRRFLNKLVH